MRINSLKIILLRLIGQKQKQYLRNVEFASSTILINTFYLLVRQKIKSEKTIRIQRIKTLLHSSNAFKQ
jgi:hypothetical protein